MRVRVHVDVRESACACVCACVCVREGRKRAKDDIVSFFKWKLKRFVNFGLNFQLRVCGYLLSATKPLSTPRLVPLVSPLLDFSSNSPPLVTVLRMSFQRSHGLVARTEESALLRSRRVPFKQF